MPAGTTSPKRQDPPQTLVIGESVEAAYRYAGSDDAEVELLVVGPDGAIEPVGDSFARVVVAGFASAPGTLRTVVDQAFEIAADGQVVIGAGAGLVEPDVAAWDAAFTGLRVASVDRGSFPAVELTRDPVGTAGAFLAGALSVLGLVDPHPDVKVEPAPVLEQPPAATKAKPHAPRPSRKQQLVDLARSRSKLLLAAAVVVIVGLAISVGLVALLGEYVLAIVVTLTLFAVMGHALLQERRNQQIARELARVASGQSGFRTKVLEQLRDQGKTIADLQKVGGINQLAIVDAAKALQRLEASSRDKQ